MIVWSFPCNGWPPGLNVSWIFCSVRCAIYWLWETGFDCFCSHCICLFMYFVRLLMCLSSSSRLLDVCVFSVHFISVEEVDSRVFRGLASKPKPKSVRCPCGAANFPPFCARSSLHPPSRPVEGTWLHRGVRKGKAANEIEWGDRHPSTHTDPR